MTMRTMHSVVKRGALYWDRKLLPEQAYRARLSRIQERIAEHGDDAWLMMGDVEAHGPVVYATNFMPRVRSALAFVPREGEPILLANISTRDIPAAKTITFIDEIRAFGRISKDLLTLLDEKTHKGARIGTCGVAGAMPYPEWGIIAQARPDIVWTERDAALAGMRVRKDEHEVAAVARASRIAAEALDGMGRLLQHGTDLRAAMAGLERLCRIKGAEDVRILVSASLDGRRPLRPAHDKALGRRDVVLVYIAVQNQRYWGEATRTFAIGPAPAPVTDAYAKCVSAIARMRELCRPGVAMSEIESAGRDGLGELYASATMYGLGGGVGLDHAEGPRLAPDSMDRLNGGETIALRVVAHGASAGAAVGETLQVTNSGVVQFNSAPLSISVL